MKDLITISRYAGMREDLVQAGGGNTSVKLDENQMAIKASGIQLAEVSKDHGYSVVNYPLVKQSMDKLVRGENTDTEEQILNHALLKGKRSSIETFLHAITGKVTLHTHPTAVNILTSRTGGIEILKEMFPDSLTVGYATPGLKLAELYYRTYLSETRQQERDFPVIFLKNHGMIVSGETAEEVIQITEDILRKTERKVGLDCQAYRHAYELYEKFRKYGIGDEKITVKAENQCVLDAYEKLSYSLWDYQVCPDCIVFCGKKGFRYEKDCTSEDLQNFIQDYGVPVLIQYGHDLFIRAESVKKAREIESVLAFSAQVFLFNQGQSLELLSDQEQDFLLNWDAEKYRQAIK